MKIGIVILAAGESLRMGPPKAVLNFKGTTLINHAINEALGTNCYPITMVLGANKREITPFLKDVPINIIDNNSFKTGIASSFKYGLAGTYMMYKEIDAVLFMPIDMPQINSDIINSLLALEAKNPKKCAFGFKYKNEIQFPILLKRSILENVLDLKEDEGLDELVAKLKNEIVVKELNEKMMDINTKEEFYDFINSKN